MNLPYEKLTPILGDSATYDPKTETTPDFMNGKFEELLQNDKACKEQINVCLNKTKKLAQPSLSKYETNEQDLNLFIGETKKLFVFNAINAPINGHGWIENVYYDGTAFSPEGYGVTKVNYQTWRAYKSDATYQRQIIIYSDSTKNIITNWQEISTTTKTIFSLTPNTGYTITSQRCYVLNGIKHIQARIKKTDGTAFKINTAEAVCSNMNLFTAYPFTGMGLTGSTWRIATNVYTNGVNLYVVAMGENCTEIMIQGVMD